MADAATIDSAATTTAATTTAATTSAASTADPYYRDLIGSDGSINHKSLERLPEHVKGVSPLLQNCKTLDDVFMRYEQANNLASKKALAPLLPNAPKELVAERKALLDAMNGVPKEPKDYGIAKPKDLPDRVWHQGLADFAANWAHKWSVGGNALKELIDGNLGFVKGQLDHQAQEETQFWAKEQKVFEDWTTTKGLAADRATALLEKAVVGLGLDPKDKQTEIWLKSALTRRTLIEHAISTGDDNSAAPSGGGGEGTNYAELAASARRDPDNPLYGPYRNIGGKYSRGDHEAAMAKVHEWDKKAIEQESRRAARRGQ
jgi:hypothetical protein